jgi:glucose/arabinose dehydrogenase
MTETWGDGVRKRLRNTPSTARRMQRLLVVLSALVFTSIAIAVTPEDRIPVVSGTHELVTIADNLAFPWRIAFLSDHEILISERPGRVRYENLRTRDHAYLRGIPEVVNLFDIAVTRTSRGHDIYLVFSQLIDGKLLLKVLKASLRRQTIRTPRTLFVSRPGFSDSVFSGGRLVILPDKSLLLTVGDQPEPYSQAQDPGSHAGSVVRILTTGGPASDNPFLGRIDVLPEIYAKGLRNSQGIARDALTGAIWLVDHGPTKGDELNLLVAGGNFGWPARTAGTHLNGAAASGATMDGSKIREPIHGWDETVAPSGLAVYRGARYAGWDGSLLVGSLAGRHLRRLEIKHEQLVREEILFEDLGERIRDVGIGPDGFVYLLTDSPSGKLLRVEPTAISRRP